MDKHAKPCCVHGQLLLPGLGLQYPLLSAGHLVALVARVASTEPLQENPQSFSSPSSLFLRHWYMQAAILTPSKKKSFSFTIIFVWLHKHFPRPSYQNFTLKKLLAFCINLVFPKVLSIRHPTISSVSYTATKYITKFNPKKRDKSCLTTTIGYRTNNSIGGNNNKASYYYTTTVPYSLLGCIQQSNISFFIQFQHCAHVPYKGKGRVLYSYVRTQRNIPGRHVRVGIHSTGYSYYAYAR